jgi:excisionase family DNA binding protein
MVTTNPHQENIVTTDPLINAEGTAKPVWYTSRQAADYLGVHQNHLRSIEAKDLPYYSIGRNRRYIHSDLVAFMESIRVSK